MPEEQRKIFTSNDWEIVDAARSVHNSPPPLCYSSVWLSMNCLVLDHKTVVVEASETRQMEQMDKLGMNVIPVAFRDAYPFAEASIAPQRMFSEKVIARIIFRSRCREPKCQGCDWIDR